MIHSPHTHAQAVRFDAVTRRFGDIEVLHGVTFEVQGGTIHALLGENGAGKSTLMKVLGGYHAPTSGAVWLGDERLELRGSRDAEARGIVLIHQEFNLAEDLTVAQNIYLGHELGGAFLDDAAMRRGASEVLSRLGVGLDPDVRVRDLAVPMKQLVEIARALSRQARVLIMDEPTAALTPHETDTLFALMRRLQGDGVTILYISHKLGEVKAVTDRVTVLRDGHVVMTADTADLSTAQMANAMVGRELEAMFPPQEPPGTEELLHVEGLDVPGWAHDVGFTLRRGEVLGFAGLVGAGRTECIEGLLGLRPHRVRTVRVRGRPVRLRSPADGVRAGVVYLSEDRAGKGLHVTLGLKQNLTLMTLEHYARPLLDTRAEDSALRRAVQTFGIRAGRLDVPAGSLSGGNQQKLALAKILEVQPEVVILDEPTRGVDVGAKRDIYALVGDLARQGRGVIVISSELPELLGLCHRLIVMHEGHVVGDLGTGGLTEQDVIQYATGLQGRGHRVPA
ncbi:sugar ABC transporter ATP-binding protein [uncultured Deinococcus sp.]|uniref:sugar ABC transporter ATP-binding protein n=1 Tax=uncultured Deinococcus sp. TaxID=158789 RepID=UPI0025EE38AD|nr:sugar ABC transporter ATP-binding protein [uncultured Deinococcus sp.]